MLPTGYGKSDIYMYFTKISSKTGWVLVISPLKGLVSDQIERYRDINKCDALSNSNMKKITEGKYRNCGDDFHVLQRCLNF